MDALTFYILNRIIISQGRSGPANKYQALMQDTGRSSASKLDVCGRAIDYLLVFREMVQSAEYSLRDRKGDLGQRIEKALAELLSPNAATWVKKLKFHNIASECHGGGEGSSLAEAVSKLSSLMCVPFFLPMRRS